MFYTGDGQTHWVSPAEKWSHVTTPPLRSQRHLRSRSQLDFHGSLVYTEGVALCASSAESTKLENLICKCNTLAINAHVCDVTDSSLRCLGFMKVLHVTCDHFSAGDSAPGKGNTDLLSSQPPSIYCDRLCIQSVALITTLA